MQCTSYIPVYYHARDLNVGASGFAWHRLNNNANYGEERGYDISLPPCTMDQYLGYDKEVLKQIMQSHEGTFRYQVQELHRLYRRQRELMDEMRMREMFTQHLLLQTSESIDCLSQTRSDISQTTSRTTSWLLGDHSHSKLSVPTAENIRTPPTSVAENFQEVKRPTTVCPVSLIRNNSYLEPKSLSSRSKGNEKGILNLELPADVYHDDEGEQFEEGNLSEAPEVTCNTPKKFPDIQPASDSEIGSVKTGHLSSFDLTSEQTNFLIDLNEPIQLESLASSSTGPFATYTCRMEIMPNHPCISGEEKPESIIPKHSGLLNCDSCSDGINSSVAIDLNSLPVSYFPETAITLENLRIMNKESTAVLDGSSAHEHAMRKGKYVEDNPVIDTGISDNFLKIKTYTDLNTGVVVDEPSPPLSSTIVGIKSAGEADLEGPVSPENKECSPPRGKSEDIQLETPLLLSGRVEGEPSLEIDKIAAQTLVMISSSRVQEHLKTASNEALGNLSNGLCWLAEIVSSTGDDLENEFIKLQNGPTEDFGETKLNLFDENAASLCHIVENEKEKSTVCSRSGLGHTRGIKQRKDFLTEALPSLASLPKDLHTIEGSLKTGSVKRNAGRKCCPKLRKSSKLSPPNVAKKSMSSILKQPATCSKQGVLLSWGKIKKRQGCRKRRASKFLVMS